MSVIRSTIFIYALVLTACGGPPPDLPTIPVVDAGQVLPAVRAQMEQARDALAAAPLDASKNGQLAMVLHAYARNEDAVALYERARRLAPKEPGWPYYQSAVLKQLGELDRSLLALNEALRLSPDHIDVMAKRGEALFLLGQLDEAELQLNEVVKKNYKYFYARFFLGRLHMERQEWNKAVDEFQSLLAAGLNVRDVHQNLGVALRMLGNTDEAAKHLEMSARQEGLVIENFDPINRVIAELNAGDKPHLAKAGDLYARGQLAAAIEELETAIKKNPDSLGAHLHLIRFYAEQGDINSARTHYEAVMGIDANNAIAHSSWGLALVRFGQDEAALRTYRRAIHADPRDPKARIAIADILTRLERYDEALIELDQVQDLVPDDRNALHLRGNILIAQGKYSEALIPLEKVRQHEDTSTPMVLRGIAFAQYALGQTDSAKRQLDAAVTLAKKQNNQKLVQYLEGERRRLAEVTSE